MDIFFQSRKDFDEAVIYYNGLCGEDNKGGTYRLYYENPNVRAYKNVATGITIELCCKIFGTAEDILNSFDFTIVKFAYYKEEVPDTLFDEATAETHTEYKILCHDMFFEHLHMKRLVIDDKIPFPMSTFERIVRYAKYGYFPCKETKMKIIKALREVPEEQMRLLSARMV